jgi:hypothetical protein
MSHAMPSKPALSFDQRWKLVNQRLRDENARQSLAQKLQQVASLMASVDALGWRVALGSEDRQVRELWMKLRAASPWTPS